ncbi:MAG: thermonuclease family protein, partial [Syntrophobacteraceae bacterium]|nr:thermonuclease family protein [Syntrophobacteraceae bacterium]
IRLHGVDAPEKAQAFGQKAKDFTSRLVFGKEVKVEFEAPATEDSIRALMAEINYPVAG